MPYFMDYWQCSRAYAVLETSTERARMAGQRPDEEVIKAKRYFDAAMRLISAGKVDTFRALFQGRRVIRIHDSFVDLVRKEAKRLFGGPEEPPGFWGSLEGVDSLGSRRWGWTNPPEPPVTVRGPRKGQYLVATRVFNTTDGVIPCGARFKVLSGGDKVVTVDWFGKVVGVNHTGWSGARPIFRIEPAR